MIKIKQFRFPSGPSTTVTDSSGATHQIGGTVQSCKTLGCDAIEYDPGPRLLVLTYGDAEAVVVVPERACLELAQPYPRRLPAQPVPVKAAR